MHEADPTRQLPEIRDARREPVPFRDGEVVARVHQVKNVSCVYPNGRLWIGIMDPVTHAGIGQKNEKEMVVMKALDRRGIETISQVLITQQDLPTVIKRLLGIYKAAGGSAKDIAALLPVDD
jgi:hypothetical protein